MNIILHGLGEVFIEILLFIFFPRIQSLNSNKTFQPQMSLKREGDQYQVSSVLDY